MRKKNEVTRKKIPLWGKALIILLVIVLAFIGFSYGMILTLRGILWDFAGFWQWLAMEGSPLPEGYCHFCAGGQPYL